MRLYSQLHLNRNQIPVLNPAQASHLINEIAATTATNNEHSERASEFYLYASSEGLKNKRARELYTAEGNPIQSLKSNKGVFVSAYV